MVRYAREVEGLTLPVRLGGHAALDFCNTAAGWGEAPRKEYLVSPRHLAVWALEAGLVDAAEADELVLARALRFREALYPALVGRGGEADWAVVAGEVEWAAASARFVAPGSWVVPASADAPLVAVARAAAELLASPARAHVRACPGAACGWLFLDERGRRRWCDMAVCGNRAKARRHAERARLRPRTDGTRG